MRKTHLAILAEVPPKTAGREGRLDELRQEIYSKAMSLAAPYIDSSNQLFPAGLAWNQRVYEPYGVLFGKSDPALFMYFFMNARSAQEEHVVHRFYSFLAASGEKLADGLTNGTGLSAYMVDREAVRRDPWMTGFFTGKFSLDFGLYSIPHKKANLEDDEVKQIQKNMDKYALCILDVYL